MSFNSFVFVTMCSFPKLLFGTSLGCNPCMYDSIAHHKFGKFAFWEIFIESFLSFGLLFPASIPSRVWARTMVMKEAVEFVFINHVHLVYVSPCLVSFPLMGTFPTIPCHEFLHDIYIFISFSFFWVAHTSKGHKRFCTWLHNYAAHFLLSRNKVPISWSKSCGRPWFRLTSNFMRRGHLDVPKYETPWASRIIPSTNCWNTNPQVVNDMSHANNQR